MINAQCLRALTTAFAFLILAGGAGRANTVLRYPPGADNPAAAGVAAPDDPSRMSPARLQLEVMDFSDQYVSAMWSVMDDYIRTEPDVSRRVLAQSWKVLYGSSSMSIAASADPRTNLLDMAIFISAGRWAVNRYWIPKVFGDRADPLSSLYDDQYRKVWKLAAEVLTPDQVHGLQALLAAWEEQNPAVNQVADIRLRNLEGVRPGEFDPKISANGILAAVQKLLGRVNNSLLYGERIMFYMERTPRILTQQTDLTLGQIAEAFPLAAVRPGDIPGFSGDWPAKLQAGIDHNQALAKDLLPEVRTTLEKGDHLATTLNTTLHSVQDLADRTRVSDISPADLSRSLAEANSALDHLDSTVAGVNRLLDTNTGRLSSPDQLARLINDRAEHLMNLAFRRVLVLMGVFFAGILGVLLAARLIFSRKAGSSRSVTP